MLKKHELQENENFIGTYLTENNSIAVVVAKSSMISHGRKRVIWLGFITNYGGVQGGSFCVWDSLGMVLGSDKDIRLNLKEAMREQAY